MAPRDHDLVPHNQNALPLSTGCSALHRLLCGTRILRLARRRHRLPASEELTCTTTPHTKADACCPERTRLRCGSFT